MSDFFIETEETFEVLLLPNPEDLLAAMIQPGKDRAIITISDSQEENSKYIMYSISISYWMGSRPISLDIGQVCAVFGRVRRMSQI